MTYVEFYDKDSVENICTCLVHIPERVVLVGNNYKKMKKTGDTYARIFQKRGHHVVFCYATVSKSNLGNAVNVLQGIVDKYGDCVFDITGGNEILSMALGIVYERNPGKNLQIHRINVQNNVISSCDMDGVTIFGKTPKLTVEENINIYGGEVVYGESSKNVTPRWQIDAEFAADIDRMWLVCKNNARDWNAQLGVFGAVWEIGLRSEDGLHVTAYVPAVEKYLIKNKGQYVRNGEIIESLLAGGFLTEFSDDERTVTVAFKNEQIKRCLTKAGQVLEMKLYLIAKEMKNEDGTPFFDDVMNGVVIDWDGEFHDEEHGPFVDTENEIDILMMHDIVPLFVSCKNGDFSADELYKLDTVAYRFGGKHAKTALASTVFGMLGAKKRYLSQRCADMGISLMKNVSEMSDAEMEDELRKACLKP